MSVNDAGQRTCSVCGAAVRPDDHYCPNCGSPVDRQSPEEAGSAASSEQPTAPFTVQTPEANPMPPPPPPPAAPLYSPSGYAEPGWSAPPQSRQGTNRTWWIVGGLLIFFLLVCCCCAALVFVTASQDSALQEEIEGTALLLGALGAATRARS